MGIDSRRDVRGLLSLSLYLQHLRHGEEFRSSSNQQHQRADCCVVGFATNLILCGLVWRWKIVKKGPAWPSFGQYRHAEHEMVGLDDSIHVDLDKIAAMADYPPAKATEESEFGTLLPRT